MARYTKQTQTTPVPNPSPSSSDVILRDDLVPELARRIRGTRQVWVVYWRDGATPKKRTLGSCATITVERARHLARDMVDAGFKADTSSLSALTFSAFSKTFLEDCAGRWKPSTLKTNQTCLQTQILPHFGRQTLGSLSREDVVAWMTNLGLSKGANNRALSVLSSLCVHAELRGLVPPGSNPCKGLRRHETSFQACYLTEAQYALLGAAFDALQNDHPQAIHALRFLTLTGCRRGEALGLKWEMIDGKRAALPDAKSGPKSIWLGKAARYLLSECPRRSHFVFGSDEVPLQSSVLTLVWNDIRDPIGMPSLRIHDLRHSFASVALGLGHDLILVGGLLGHSDKGSTAGYAHFAGRDVADASMRVGTHFQKIMRRKGSKPVCHNSDVVAFTRSKDIVSVFCQKHGLDADRSRRDLLAWRKTEQAAKKATGGAL